MDQKTALLTKAISGTPPESKFDEIRSASVTKKIGLRNERIKQAPTETKNTI
jgi:hypothetical protein